jgi:hypothetical protein
MNACSNNWDSEDKMLLTIARVIQLRNGSYLVISADFEKLDGAGRTVDEALIDFATKLDRKVLELMEAHEVPRLYSAEELEEQRPRHSSHYYDANRYPEKDEAARKRIRNLSCLQ